MTIILNIEPLKLEGEAKILVKCNIKSSCHGLHYWICTPTSFTFFNIFFSINDSIW